MDVDFSPVIIQWGQIAICGSGVSTEETSTKSMVVKCLLVVWDDSFRSYSRKYNFAWFVIHQ